LTSIVTSLVPIEEHSPTSGSVSPMSCQQPVTDVLSVGIRWNYREVLEVTAECVRRVRRRKG
jgi:hypothetical protein